MFIVQRVVQNTYLKVRDEQTIFLTNFDAATRFYEKDGAKKRIDQFVKESPGDKGNFNLFELDKYGNVLACERQQKNGKFALVG